MIGNKASHFLKRHKTIQRDKIIRLKAVIGRLWGIIF